MGLLDQRLGRARGRWRASLPAAACVWLATALCIGGGFQTTAPVTAAGAAQAAGVVQTAGPAQGGQAQALQPVAATLATYCVGCHNDKRPAAGLSLDAFDAGTVSTNPRVWEPVIRRLRTRTMPPAGMPRPDDRTYDAVASLLENAIDVTALKSPDPGRTTAFHRLNRAEYHNAVRDLLAVDVDVTALLPADNTFEGGFDNNGAALSVSPTQIERYMSAASKISRLAVGIPPASPGVDVHRVHLNMVQDDRVDEDQPFGSRGGVAIRHYFPVDGEYAVRIQLQKQYNDYIRGMGSRQLIDVRVDGVRVARFSVGGEARGKTAPASFAGNILGDPDWERYVLSADANLEVRFPANAGPRIISVSFERAQAEAEGVLQPRQTGFPLAADERYHGNAAVDTVALSGPYSSTGPGDTPSRRRIFVCRPGADGSEEACARRILSAMARRAYRRPIVAGDADVLFAFYQEGRRAANGNFDTGIQRAIERLLVDPEFLFRIERDPADAAPGAAYPVSDVALASRLSFFLWNSVPDDQLLDLAARGRLRQPAILDRVVRRMLADDRATSLVNNFAAQWLNLRNLDDVLPDPDRFPEFDENLRRDLRRETELFVESTIREDRSIVDLVGANYTYVNERVAQHYGIPGIYGQQFRRVTFKPGEPRGGLLGQGSILTVSSHPTRTSPVLRGKWLLQNLLGTTPPEPPPNVPALPEPADGAAPTTVRALLERHRASPACASCHAPIDPLGLALENFDAIGRWRTDDDGARIDAAAVTPAGVRVEGPAGVRDLLLAQRGLFVGAVAEKLLAYAIGRGLDDHDRPMVRKIVRDSAASDYRWSALVLAIVRSPAFQMRRAWSETAAAAR